MLKIKRQHWNAHCRRGHDRHVALHVIEIQSAIAPEIKHARDEGECDRQPKGQRGKRGEPGPDHDIRPMPPFTAGIEEKECVDGHDLRAALEVVVFRDERQRTHGGPGVNGQQRIEQASRQIDGRHAALGWGPLVPNRIATRAAGVVRFTRLFCREKCRAFHRPAQVRQRLRVDETVIGRPAEAPG